jgi:CHAT domain-containing protein
LLHYYLGEKRSFLWLVTSATVDAYILPARDELEALARTVYDEFSHLTIGASCSETNAMRELSNYLLSQVRDKIKNRRLLVVPDGAISYVTFSALPDPNAPPSLAGECYAPLVNNHEVVNLPSATTLSVQRKASAGRTLARRAIAIFADPVYGATDSRLADVETPAAPSSRTPTVAEAGILVNSDEPERLVATGIEANMIAAAESGWHTDTYLGFSANKDTFVKRATGDYRVMHVATHGILDSQRPSLSSLMLSRYSEDGQLRDGYLRLQDIYGLKLKSDLIVLSGCETALGKKIRGEGFMGLTRGFMYAGARMVIASLWRVEDTATAELMQHFYDALIQDDMTAAQALRHAQLKIAKDRRWQQPYYWAAFVLQGDWR